MHFFKPTILAIALFPLPALSQEINDIALLDSVLGKYQNLPFYRDTGRINQASIEGLQDRQHTLIKTFSTFYVRPHYYEMEVARQNLRSPLALIQTGVYYNESTSESLYWVQRGDYPVEVKPKALNRAIASVVGTAGSFATFIPKLLMPEKVVGSDRFVNYDKMIRLPDENIRGHQCYKLHLFFRTTGLENPIYDQRRAEGLSVTESNHVIYWIRKSDLMIIRYVSELDLGKREIQEMVDIYPLVE